MSPAKKSLVWSGVWFAAALAFFGGLRAWRGSEPANQFLAGYLVELSLSLDNVFVFAILFDHFGIVSGLQRRVLFWGIIGSALLRGLFILVGVGVLARFHWILYGFGVLIVITAAKMLRSHRKGWVGSPDDNLGVRLMARIRPLKDPGPEGRFIVREEGRVFATRLLMALIVIELTDVVFAFDSLPAVLAFTRSTAIAFSSNLFAVVGLRSLYFALGGLRQRFRYLDLGLAAVLFFIGVKILASPWYEVPTGTSLAIVLGILASAAAVSVRGRGHLKA